MKLNFRYDKDTIIKRKRKKDVNKTPATKGDELIHIMHSYITTSRTD
jgi:hypothetical protein